MRIDLKDKISWVNQINAKSSKSAKSYQQDLANAINRELLSQSAPVDMSIGVPTSLSVVTKQGSTSRRHFIGGEHLRLKCATITQRTYKLMLEFSPVDASDIETIRVPLDEALQLISGLEIRVLACTAIMNVIENTFAVLKDEKVEKEAVKFGGKYDAIGFGSW